MEQEQEGAKRLRLHRQHLAGLDERELPLPNLHVVEAENKGLTRHHKFITRHKKLVSSPGKLIASPSRPRRAIRPEFLQPTRLRSSRNDNLPVVRSLGSCRNYLSHTISRNPLPRKCRRCTHPLRQPPPDGSGRIHKP